MERNHLMTFVLQIVYVVGKDDKESCGEEQVIYLREAQIDQGTKQNEGDNDVNNKEDSLLHDKKPRNRYSLHTGESASFSSYNP
jgi:hypothetical protein